MPRIRTIKPEAPQHRKVGRLSIPARWLWLVMITQSDDAGRFVADPGQLRVAAFGYDLGVTDEEVAGWRDEIAATGLISLYSVRNRAQRGAAVTYGCFPSWTEHQRIDRPSPSRLPQPPHLRSTRSRRAIDEPSTSTRRVLALDQGSDQGSEGSGSEGTRAHTRALGSPITSDQDEWRDIAAGKVQW